MNFIRTTDESTAEKLIKLGFQQIDNSNGAFTFINCNKMQFSDDVDKTKIHYTNMLCI